MTVVIETYKDKWIKHWQTLTPNGFNWMVLLWNRMYRLEETYEKVYKQTKHEMGIFMILIKYNSHQQHEEGKPLLVVTT